MTKYVTVAFVTSDIQVHQKKMGCATKVSKSVKIKWRKDCWPPLKTGGFGSPNRRTRLQGTHDGLVGSEDLLRKRRTLF